MVALPLADPWPIQCPFHPVGEYQLKGVCALLQVPLVLFYYRNMVLCLARKFSDRKKKNSILAVVTRVFNPSTGEAKEGGSLFV